MSDLFYVMLVGLPGSGKTAIRKELYSQMHADGHRPVVLSRDDLLEVIAAREGKTYREAFATNIGAVMDRLEAVQQEAIDARHSIINDDTNLRGILRRKALEKIPVSYMRIAILTECPEDVRQQSIASRPGRAPPTNVDAAMRKSLVAPTIAEGFDLVLRAEKQSDESIILH